RRTIQNVTNRGPPGVYLNRTAAVIDFITRHAPRVLYALTALVCLSATPADALDPARTLTQYVHRIWQVQQGLPQASIYAIAQTADGRLWLGTQKGLVTLDGVRFTTLSNDAVAPGETWVTPLPAHRPPPA